MDKDMLVTAWKLWKTNKTIVYPLCSFTLLILVDLTCYIIDLWLQYILIKL
jgi:hypothetical protein